MEQTIEMLDILGMSNGFRDRVVQRIQDLGIDEAEVARRMGKRGSSFINDIVQTRKKSIRAESMGSLAKALECSTLWLSTGEGPIERAAPSSNGSAPKHEISAPDGQGWDHEAFSVAVDMAEAMLAKEGIENIGIDQYVDIVHKFYRRALVTKTPHKR